MSVNWTTRFQVLLELCVTVVLVYNFLVPPLPWPPALPGVLNDTLDNIVCCPGRAGHDSIASTSSRTAVALTSLDCNLCSFVANLWYSPNVCWFELFSVPVTFVSSSPATAAAAAAAVEMVVAVSAVEPVSSMAGGWPLSGELATEAREKEKERIMFEFNYGFFIHWISYF